MPPFHGFDRLGGTRLRAVRDLRLWRRPRRLDQALDALIAARGGTGVGPPAASPICPPPAGDRPGPAQVLDLLAPIVLAGARDLGALTAFAHMDPPTPWLTWAMGLWTKAYNQNLLHRCGAGGARLGKPGDRLVGALFGMDGGHLTAGSTWPI